MTASKGFAMVGFLFLLLLISSEVAAARSLNLAGKNAVSRSSEFQTPRTDDPNKPVCDRRPGRYDDCMEKPPQPTKSCDPFNRNCP